MQWTLGLSKALFSPSVHYSDSTKHNLVEDKKYIEKHNKERRLVKWGFCWGGGENTVGWVGGKEVEGALSQLSDAGQIKRQKVKTLGGD